MNRRDFLRLVASGAVGAAVADIPTLEWVPSTPAIPTVVPVGMTNLWQIASAALTQLDDQMRGARPRLPITDIELPRLTFSDRVNQFGVEFELETPDEPIFVSQHLEPTIAAMTHRMRQLDPNLFGVLPVPPSIDDGVFVSSVKRRLALRALRHSWFDIYEDRVRHAMRFDVICARV